ncbi:hypothetical protein ACIBKY_50690 [Nonomuraea sp. NPDC050394]|uniref:hypothetical protein n=1 Tax=Nonomuraea sp. NPDC050394 TaxID=3364363 RepID=UPI0037BA78AF
MAIEFGHVAGGLRSGVRGTMEPGLVWPATVVVEHDGRVAFIEDQDPVQEFAAQGADDPVSAENSST